MRSPLSGGPSTRNTRSTRPTWTTAAATAVVTAVIGALVVAVPAQAATGDVAEAEGRLLSGSGIVNANGIVALNGAYADTAAGGSAATVSNPLSLSAVNGLANVGLGNGVTLLGQQGILTLGAAGQYASTTPTSATASAGTITASGAISAGSGTPGEGATLDLAPLLSRVGAATNVLSAAQLQVGALASTETATRNTTTPTVTSSYNIASARLTLTSPAVANLATALQPTLTTLGANVNAISGSSSALASVSTGVTTPLQNVLSSVAGGAVTLSGTKTVATVGLDLSGTLQPVLARSYTSGPVTLTPSTGSIVVDLAQLHALNGQDPNTPILTTASLDTVNAAIASILGVQLPAALQTAVQNTVNGTAITLEVTAAAKIGVLTVPGVDITVKTTLGQLLGTTAGTPTITATGLGLTAVNLASVVAPVVTGTLLPLTATVLSPLAGPTALQNVGTALITTTTGVATTIAPIASLLGQVIGLTVNAQDSSGFSDARGTSPGSVSVHALRVSVLPGVNVATIDLATSTVRASAFVAPTITAPTAAQVFSVPTASATRTVTVTGAGEPGATIAVSLGGGLTGSATVAADGTWSAPVANVPVGSYTATATQSVGTTPAGTATRAFSVVAQQPLTIATPTVNQTFTVVTPTAPVTLTGTATAGATIAVDLGGGLTATGTAGSDGRWSVVVPNVPSAGTPYTASVTQTVGDTTSAPVTRAFSVIAATPLTVTTPSGDTTDYPVADATGTRTIPFSGSAQAGATVTVDLGTGGSATTTADASGAWTLSVPNVPVGTFTASTTQTVGGTRSAAVTRTVRVLAATGVTITAPADGATITVPDASSTTPVTVTGTAAANAPVTVSLGGAFVTTTTADGAGNWAASFTGVPVGTRTVAVTQTVGGTTSAAVTRSLSIVPGAPLVVTAPAPSSTITVVDQDATTDVPVTGTAQPGAAVTVSLGGAFVAGSTADGAGNWSATIRSVPVGVRTLTVTQTVGGVVSPAQTSTLTIAAGSPLVVAAPANGSTLTVAAAGSIVDVPVSGTAQPGATVSVALDAGTAVTTTADGNGAWALTLPAVAVGTHAAVVRQIVAGTASAATTRSFAVQTGAPVVITAPAAGSQIAAGTDGTAAAVVTGTAQPGAAVTVDLGAGTTPQTVTAGADGRWSVPVAGLVVGPWTASVTETVNGTVAPAVTRAFTVVAGGPIVITTPPTGTQFTVVDADSTTPVTIGGTAAPSATVTVTLTPNAGTVTTLPAVVDPATGAWTVTFPSLGVARYAVTATQTVAGTSTDAVPTRVQVIAVAPVTITTPTTTPAIPVAGADVTSTVPVSGTAAIGASVVVTLDGTTTLPAVTAGADGTWSVAFPDVLPGAHELSVQQTVQTSAGTATSTAVLRDFSITPATPIAITTPGVADGVRVADTTSTVPLTVSGTAADAVPVTVTLDGTTTLATTSSATGTWSVTFPAVGVGAHPITASQTVGGTTASAGTRTFTVTPGSPLTVTTPATAQSTITVAEPSSRTTVPLAGTADANATVTIDAGDGAPVTVRADGDGNWATTFGPVGPGQYQLAITQTVGTTTSPAILRTVAVAPGTPLTLTVPTPGTTITLADAGATTPLTVSGTGQVGASVDIELSDGLAAGATVDGTGTWTATLPAVPVGTPTISVTQTIGGTTSGALTGSVAIVAAPALTIRQPAAGATIDVADGASTTTVTVAGDAAPGAAVAGTIDATPFQATADATGAWTADVPGIGTGAHATTATQTVGASVSSPVTAAFRVEAGAALVVTTPTDGQTFRVGDAGATTTVTVTGTAEPGATVVASLGGDLSGTVQAAGDGSWSIPLANVPAGLATLTVTQQVRDTTSAPLTRGIAVVAATPLTIQTPADQATIAVAQGDSTTPVTVAGQAAAGAAIAVALDGGSALTTTAGSDGRWSVGFTGVGTGPHTASATQTVDGSRSGAVTRSFQITAGSQLVVTAPAPNATITVLGGTGTGTGTGSVTTSVPVTGVGQPGATIVAVLGSGAPVTATVSGDGTWALSIPGVPVGTAALSVTQTVGSTTSSPVTEQITVRTADPVAITSPAADATITVAEDASLVTVPVSGTAEPGAGITVGIGSASAVTTTADAQGSWSVLVPGVASGPRTITVSETVGTATSVPVTRPITIVAGAPVTVTSPTGGSQVVAADPDGTASVVLTGTAQPGALVAVDLGDGHSATTTAGPTGAWSVTVTGVPTGDATASVTQTVTGTTSTPLTRSFTVVPAGPIVIQSPITGTRIVVATDDATTPVAVSGVAEPGAAVTVARDGDTATLSATADTTTGSWSVTFPALGTGTHTFGATETIGGTTTDAVPVSVLVAPAAPVTITAPTAGTTVQVADTAATTNVVVAGTAEPGTAVAIALTGAATTGTHTATATAGQDGTWSATVTGLPVETFTITATGVIGGATSGTAQGTVTVAAAAPVVITSPTSGGTVVVAGPATTADVPVTGTAAPGALVVVDLGAGHTASTTAGTDGSWSVTITGVPEGPWTASVVQTVGGTTSVPVTRGFDVAVTAPLDVVSPAPGTSVAAVGDGGTADITLIGSAEPGASVTADLGDGHTATVTADATTGAWTATVPGVPVGLRTLRVTQRVAGVLVGTVTQQLTVTRAAALAVTDPAPDDAVAAADGTSATVTVAGTGEPGSIVAIDAGDGGTATTTVGTDGTWTTDLAGLAVGQYTLHITQTKNGTTSAPQTRSFRVLAAARVVVTAPADDAMVAATGADGTATVVLTGTAEPGATIAVALGDGTTGTAVADANGDWSATLVGVTPGDKTASITQTVNGTTSVPVRRLFRVVAPGAVVITSPTSGTPITIVAASGTQDVVLTGSATPGATVTVQQGTDDPVAATIDDAGDWSLVVRGLGAGSYTFTATQTIGGTSTTSVPVTVPIRQGAALRVTAPDDGDVFPIVAGSTADVPFAGTGQPGATVTVDLGDGVIGTTVIDTTGAWSLDVAVPADTDAGSRTARITQSIDGQTSAVITRTVSVTDGATLTITPLGGTDGTAGSGTVVGFGPASTVDVPVSGTGEPGATVHVTIGDQSATTTVGDDGSWSVTVPAVPAGAATVTATQQLGAATSDPVEAPVDVVIAQPVTITTPGAGDAVHTVDPQGTGAVTVTGTADPGAIVTATVGDGHSATTTAGPDGGYVVTVTDVPTGPTTLAVTETVGGTPATDGGAPTGGTTSSPVTQPLDVDAGTALTIDAPTPDTWITVTTADGTTDVPASGVATPGATVTVRLDDGPAITAIAGPNGRWVVTLPAVGRGDHTFTAQQSIDGTTSAVVDGAFSVRVVGAPVILTPLAGETVSSTNGSTAVVVTGTSAPAATITVVVDGGTTITATADLDGDWTATVPGVGDGQHTVVVTQTVDDTVSEPASRAFAVAAVTADDHRIRILTPAPGTLVPDTQDDGTEDVWVTGTATPGALVTVTVGGGAARPVVRAVIRAAAGRTMTTTATPGGTFRVLFTGLPVGTWPVRATQVVDGTTDTANETDFTIADVDPVTVSAPANGATVTAGPDGAVDLPVSGTAEPGALVTVTLDDGTPVTTTADPTTGAWSVVIRAVRSGEHVLAVTETVDGRTTVPTTSVLTVVPAAASGTGGGGGAAGAAGTPGTQLPGMTALSGSSSSRGAAAGITDHPTGGLAFTGSDALPIVALGLVTLLAGLLLGATRIVARVRRRTRHR